LPFKAKAAASMFLLSSPLVPVSEFQASESELFYVADLATSSYKSKGPTAVFSIIASSKNAQKKLAKASLAVADVSSIAVVLFKPAVELPPSIRVMSLSPASETVKSPTDSAVDLAESKKDS
jgi:hypothetical protein